MKSSDLTTIISGVLGVALIAMAAVVLLYEPTNIVHPASSAPDIQVSSSAMPKVEQQGPRPIVLQPTAPQPMTSTAQQVTMPPPPIPFPQQQTQQQGDWRNWTAMTEVPPTQQ